MVEYNDFTLPNLESLKLMNKEFQENANINSKLKTDDAQIVFTSVHTMFYLILFLYKENRSVKNLNVYNKISAVRLKTDGEFFDFKFNEKNAYIKPYNANKMIICEYVKIIEILLNNNSNTFLVQLVSEISEIIKLMCN